MEDERPLSDARETTNQDSTMGEAGPNNRFIVPGIVLVVVLIIAGLFLPPISLGQHLGLGGVDAPETEVTDSRSIPGEISLTVKDSARQASVSRLSQESFLNSNAGEAWTGAAAAVPDDLSLQSAVYPITYDEGPAPEGAVALNVSGGQLDVDLYGWDGTSWQFVPTHYDADRGVLVADEGPLVSAYALMQVAPQTAVVSGELLPTQTLVDDLHSAMDELVVGTLTLNGDGQLAGDAAVELEGNQPRLLRVTNTGVIIDQQALSALLNDSSAQSAHIQELVDQALAGGFAGINLDYQGVDASQRSEFTAFVADLVGALNARDLSLVVTLAPPVQISDGRWETGGQDWAALGALADGVYVQMPLDPAAYVDNGPAAQQLTYAVGRVDRRKLSVMVTAQAIDAIGEVFREVPLETALSNFGELTLLEAADEAAVLPGTTVGVGLAGEVTPLTWDATSLTYRYGYGEGEQAHTVWLTNAASLSHRLRVASNYNLHGIAVRGLGDMPEVAAPSYVQALNHFQGEGEAPEPAAAAIVWIVEDETGGVVASNAGEALTFEWQAADTPGDYTINAGLAQGEAVNSLGALTLAVALPEPTATPAPEVTEEPVAEVEETPAPTTAPAAPAVNVGDADAVVNTSANVRQGPGLGYQTIGEGLNAGSQVSLIGRNSASSWFNIVLPDGETEGWIFGTLLTLNTRVAVAELPVVEVDPPVVSTDGGGAPPPPPPIANTGFELGGQTHSLANPTLMSYAGMRWVKFQHKWGNGDNGADLAGRINQAHANGFKVLLSIPGANVYPSSIDFNAYVTFLGQVAAQGPDAIEVWNEMNIDFEWPAGQINPTTYVNEMLAPAYRAIKAANPNVMVISGAPAPTGFDNGTNAWSDSRYMAGVAAAGGGSYMDCIGVHYNEGILPPSQQSGDPRVPSDYYTRYFWGMVNTYYNAFGGARPLCITELGYLSGDGFPGLPANFSWAAGTSVAEHAAWLAEAASLSASSGKVRMMIVFNVDFNYYDPNGDPQAGFAMIRPDGSCPACETLHQVTGGR